MKRISSFSVLYVLVAALFCQAYFVGLRSGHSDINWSRPIETIGKNVGITLGVVVAEYYVHAQNEK